MYRTAVFSQEGRLHFGKTQTSQSQFTGMQVEIHGSAQYLYEVTPDDLIVPSKSVNLLIAWLRFGRWQRDVVLKAHLPGGAHWRCQDPGFGADQQHTAWLWGCTVPSHGRQLCWQTTSQGSWKQIYPCNSQHTLTYPTSDLLTLSQSI